MQRLVGRQAELEAVAAAFNNPECRGVALIGPAGAGKTRLAEEACRIATDAGMEIVTAMVTSGSADIPLGALAHLLPPAGSLDDVHEDLQPAHLLRSVQSTLAARGGDRPVVLMVDDAQHLDSISAHLVHQLAAHGDVLVVLTLRAGEAVPDAIATLWTSRIIDRLDLGPLTQAEAVTMATDLLGGVIDPQVEAWLWRTSDGNALFLRELVLGGRDGGMLKRATDNRWHFVNDRGVVAPRLIELVDRRLSDLPVDLRRAMDLVALAEPVGLAVVERLTGLEPLVELEERGLVRVMHENRREDIRTAHPLYGEALRQQPLTMRRRADLRALADTVESFGARRREDAVRLAAWRLAAGGQVDPAVLWRAALAAQYSFNDIEAIRLCRLALDRPGASSGPTTGMEPEVEGGLHLCLGSCLARRARFAEAVTELQRAMDVCSRPEHVARVALSMSFTYGELSEDLPAAEKVLMEALDLSAPDSRYATELRLRLVLLRAEHGDGFSAAAELAELGGEPADGNLAIEYSLAAAGVAITTGQFDDALAIADRGLHLHLSTASADNSFHPASHIYNRVLSSVMTGNVDQTMRDAGWMLNKATEEGRPIGMTAMRCVVSTTALAQGRAHEAYAAATVALQIWTAPMQPYLLRWALASQARAALVRGELAEAQRIVAELLAIDAPTHPVSLGGVPSTLVQIELAIAEGDTARASQIATNARELAEFRGDRRAVIEIGEVELVRLLDPVAALAIGRAAAQCQGARAAALVELAEVIGAGSSPSRLAAVAERFRVMGHRLTALQLAEHAVDRAQAEGNDRLMTALSAVVADDLAQCQGIVSWAASAPNVVPLTAREREIAELVAAGRSSKAVAEQLFLSVRTVDNHLQRIYVKLGVTNRAELAHHLGGEG